jgi:hypothetical protein
MAVVGFVNFPRMAQPMRQRWPPLTRLCELVDHFPDRFALDRWAGRHDDRLIVAGWPLAAELRG